MFQSLDWLSSIACEVTAGQILVFLRDTRVRLLVSLPLSESYIGASIAWKRSCGAARFHRAWPAARISAASMFPMLSTLLVCLAA